MSKTIRKKILPEYFVAVQEGRKNFELRKDDDNAQVGDNLVLYEFENNTITGRTLTRRITYVLRNKPQYGLKEGYCIIGF